MRITFHTGNHRNSPWIGDTVRLVKHALQDCGHVACVSPRIEPGQLNILMEAFDETSLQAMREGQAAGARYVLIATELIRGGSFNGGIDGQHAHYSDTVYWRQRYESFKLAADMADAIWVLAQSMVPAYSELFPDKLVRFLPHGHVSGYATVDPLPESERDIDFYFTGSLTDHRRRILQSIGARHRVVYSPQEAPDYLRLDYLSRAKVCLSLRLSPSNDVPSVSRMHFLVQNRCFVLQEDYPLPCPLDPFVLRAPEGELLSWASAALELPNRREIADTMHDRFAAALPMSRLLPPLLEEALAVRAPRRPVAQAA